MLIPVRRNRLVSLPSWLCHLTQLETLKVDDNPFCREWQAIVAPILVNTDLTKLSSPYIPARAPSHSNQGIRAAQSASSLASSVCSTPSAREMVTSPSVDSVYRNSPISATPSLTNLGPLDAIAEDAPHSAPLRAPLPYTPTTSQPEMRRMRSAGDLLNSYNEDDTATPTPPLRTTRAGSEFLPLPTASANRLASIASSSSSSRIPSPMEESRASSGMTASSSKTGGKWGFLRKMSMNRLKPADKAALLQNSAASNLKLMPPALTHANTEPLHPPGRPAFRSAASAMTLPGSRQGSTPDVNEFGQSSGTSTPVTLPGHSLPSASSMFGFGRNKAPSRGKRRSFLPIDTPPSISLALPSTGPLMFENGFELPTSPPSASSSRPVSSQLSHSEAEDPVEQQKRDARYATGLESIKSYLRDLYDLSRPSIEPVGSFEVIGHSDGSGPTPNSPSTVSSAAAISRNSIADARRVGLNIDRRPSFASNGTGGSSAGASEPCEPIEGKKFKNDKYKRARILREIYETERTYVRGLGELVAIYVKPSGLPMANGAKPTSETVIPASERKIVFGGIESIMTIHRDNLLPALERAIRDLVDNGDDEEGHKSMATAHAVGEVFRTYIAYMKQYSTYINNFDNAQSRMRYWMASSTWMSTTPSPGMTSSKSTAPGSSIASAAAVGASLAALPMSDAVPHTGSPMTSTQRKRTKAFLKRCRSHPMHSQINLESYLLLPIQRVPRYKLLLEDLAMCTPPRETGPKHKDTLDDALAEISGLASLMNEEKREADSRLRLYHWQKRITGRGPSPLVQPHRKLILDGRLTLIRLVKKASTFVKVDRTEITDGDATIMPHKIVVPVDHIAPEPMNRTMVLILCSDMMVLAQPRNDDADGLIDLYNVLRLTSVKESASIVSGNIIRLVDHRVGLFRILLQDLS